MNYLLLIIIGIVGVWVGWKLGIKMKEKGLAKKEELNQRETKEENKNKLIEYFKTQNKIANNDVEKLLGVSDATATRYLEELEKEDKIKQIGQSGHAVYYEKA